MGDYLEKNTSLKKCPKCGSEAWAVVYANFRVLKCKNENCDWYKTVDTVTILEKSGVM